MSLRVIGAGLPRTGTTSLRAALERLTGGRCYHMSDFIPKADQHGLIWWQAMEGAIDRVDRLLVDYDAAVDWPAALLWHELADQNPDAVIVLSHRATADVWWKSVNRTVWAAMRQPRGRQGRAFPAKMRAVAGFGEDWDDETAAKARYVRHFEEVQLKAPTDRLVVWQPGDGWTKLADALGVAVPDEPFPHLNDTADFRQAMGLD